MPRFRSYLSLFALFLPLLVFGQIDYEDDFPELDTDRYYNKKLIPASDVEESGWLEKASGIDYSEERVKKKKKKKKEKKKKDKAKKEYDDSWLKSWWLGLGLIAKVLLIVILIAIVGFIIYSLTKIEGNKSFHVEKSMKQRLEDVEETLEETELEKLLRESIENGDYKLAVRLYFLMMLQNLNDRKWIAYKKQKTNFLYLREMKERPEYTQFRELTHAFEYAWYGEVDLNKDLFSRVQNAYLNFLNKLKN